jgi:hypothetical protein
MLIPPPCAETSLCPSPPRKPTTVYAASHMNQLAHTRLAHAHPYIHRHTDLHRCISARAKLSTPSIRVRLATLRRAHRPQASASAPSPLRAHTHTSRSQSLYACLQFPAPRAAPCISIVTRVPRTRHHHGHGRVYTRRPLSQRMDPLPSARQDIHGARSLSRQHPTQGLAHRKTRVPRAPAHSPPAPAAAPDGIVVAGLIPVKVSGERLVGA